MTDQLGKGDCQFGRFDLYLCHCSWLLTNHPRACVLPKGQTLWPLSPGKVFDLRTGIMQSHATEQKVHLGLFRLVYESGVGDKVRRKNSTGGAKFHLLERSV